MYFFNLLTLDTSVTTDAQSCQYNWLLFSKWTQWFLFHILKAMHRGRHSTMTIDKISTINQAFNINVDSKATYKDQVFSLHVSDERLGISYISETGTEPFVDTWYFAHRGNICASFILLLCFKSLLVPGQQLDLKGEEGVSCKWQHYKELS